MISFLSKMAHFLTILTENQRKSLIFTHIRVNFLEFNTKFTLLKRKWDIFFSKSKISLQNLRFWGKREIISSKFSYFYEKCHDFIEYFEKMSLFFIIFDNFSLKFTKMSLFSEKCHYFSRKCHYFC